MLLLSFNNLFPSLANDYFEKRALFLKTSFIYCLPQIEEEAKEHEKQMAAIRQKHNQVAEELNNQLDQVKKNKNSVGKHPIVLFTTPAIITINNNPASKLKG